MKQVHAENCELFLFLLFLLLLSVDGWGCNPAGTQSAYSQQTFLPADAGAWSAFDAAAERLNAAGGLELHAGVGGVPVTVRPRAAWESECAKTPVMWDGKTHAVISVEIIVYSPAPRGCFADISQTLVHEMIHAARLVGGLDYNAAGQGHTATGIFAANESEYRIDSASLEALCEGADCTVFAPEM